MRINGKWLLCDDGIVRPIIRGEIRTGTGSWVVVEFLVDTGADRTVLSATTLTAFNLHPTTTQDRLGGLGGLVSIVSVETQIRFRHESGGRAVFHGRYAAITEKEALDMSVLGRDITSLFAVIVDQPGNTVCLLSQRHHYTIARQ